MRTSRDRLRAALLVLLLFSPGPVFALDDAELRDRVLRAIELGQKHLIGQQNRNGSWSAGNAVGQFQNGTTGLAILALLNTGKTVKDPEVAKGLAYLRSLQDVEGESTHKTYEMALMLQALAAAKAERDRGLMLKLATNLEEYQRQNGGWKYVRQDNGDWDNSATQFALLGLREAAMAGVPINRDVWRRSQELFLANQIGPVEGPSGAGWSYTNQSDGAAYGSMTVAGLASLVITSSMLQDDSDVAPDGRIMCCAPKDDRVQKAIEASERWLGSNFSVASNPGKGTNWTFYYLYGLERAGRFSGKRFFGNADWYRAGAEFLVESQDTASGGWGEKGGGFSFSTVDTCFALLFLSKGFAPVVVNKLQFGAHDPRTGQTLNDDWNRHPRDVANLVDYITTRPKWQKYLNWQVVDLEQAVKGEGVSALLQAPVQYMSGTDRPDAIQGPQVEMLREYLMQGGFLFAVANCENTEFDPGFRDLVTRLFPNGEFTLQKLPPTHDVYRSEELFDRNPPELWGVDLGCRTAIIYAPFDHACRWQKWTLAEPPERMPEVKSQIARSMMLGINVIAYATGRELRSKLDRPQELAHLNDDSGQRGKLAIARLRHTGGWDAAPNALRHLQDGLHKVGFEVSADAPNVPATDPALYDFPLLYMHGRKNYAFSQEELDGLRKYLDNGGVLFADACCGATQFDASFRRMIEQLYGKPLEVIPVGHELYRMPLGHDIRQVTRRMPSTDPKKAIGFQESVGPPILEGIADNGRYVVIYSKYDISCALEQQSILACAGYSHLDALKIAMNMVLYGLVQ